MNLLEKKDNLKEDLIKEQKDLELLDTCMQASYKKLEQEIAIRKQTIEDSYKPTRQKIHNRMTNTNNELAKVNEEISKLNTFDISAVGPMLASIISENENEKYSFQLITADVRRIYAEMWGYDIKEDRLYVSCIAPDTQKSSYVIQEIFSEDDKLLSFDERLTVLGYSKNQSEVENKSISLNGLTMMQIIAKYPYLKGFVDYTIATRCNEETATKDLVAIYHDYLTTQRKEGKARVKK